jgi:hypothetical protein
MPLKPDTKSILQYLNANRPVRAQIRAAPSQTLLYAGAFMRPAWKEIERMRHTHPETMRGKQILPDVLARIPAPGSGFPNLLAFAQDVERKVPWRPNGFIVWRALSGIFASNAVGAVSFCILSGITADEKVFAATELNVMLRNPKIDTNSRAMLEYNKRCIETKNAEINVSFIAA